MLNPLYSEKSVNTPLAIAAYNSIAWGSRPANTYALSESIHKMQQSAKDTNIAELGGDADRRDEKTS